MTKQQLIDNYFERKEQIKKLTKGDENELPLERLAEKIKHEINPGLYGNKNVSLVPVASSPYLNYQDLKAGLSAAIWEKIKPFIKMRNESVSLTISKVGEVMPEEYRKTGFRIAAENIARDDISMIVDQNDIDRMVEEKNK